MPYVSAPLLRKDRHAMAVKMRQCRIFKMYDLESDERVNMFKQRNPHDQSVESQVNLEDLHVDASDPLDVKCRKMMEINQNMKYSLSILECQLEFLKKKQRDKTSDNSKLKEKLKQKVEKQGELKRHIKLQKEKIGKHIKGYNLLKQEVQSLKKQEVKVRSERIEAQDRKNNVYGEYQQAEEEYKKYIHGLKELEGIEMSVREAEADREDLLGKLQEIEEFLNERGDLYEHQQERKSSLQRVKEMNEKIQDLDFEEKKLLSQIQRIDREGKERALENTLISQKSAEITKMSQKLKQLQASVMSKRSTFAQLDSTYKQLSIEENSLKKEYIIERECIEEQQRYKSSKKKDNFQHYLFESEDMGGMGQRGRVNESNESNEKSNEINEKNNNDGVNDEGSNEESQVELMRIIQRYENIRNRG